MSNPNFTPEHSTYEIWRADQTTRCFEDDVADIEQSISDLETNKANSNHTHSYNDLENTPTIPTIPESLPANDGNADTVDNKHASDFAEADHTHAVSAITGLLDLLMTAADGNVKHTITDDVLITIKGWSVGMYTAYSVGGTNTTATNAPTTLESWRYIIHKTGANFGWVLAFGSSGSIYSNYLDNGTWKGWKAIWDATPKPLWSPSNGTGGYYMTAGHTVTPTKKTFGM